MPRKQESQTKKESHVFAYFNEFEKKKKSTNVSVMLHGDG